MGLPGSVMHWAEVRRVSGNTHFEIGAMGMCAHDMGIHFGSRRECLWTMGALVLLLGGMNGHVFL